MKSDAELNKLLRKFTTSELMREVRRRQVKKSDPAKRSETAKAAAIVRWAKKKGKDILGGNVAKLYLFALIQGLLATKLPNTQVIENTRKLLNVTRFRIEMRHSGATHRSP